MEPVPIMIKNHSDWKCMLSFIPFLSIVREIPTNKQKKSNHEFHRVKNILLHQNFNLKSGRGLRGEKDSFLYTSYSWAKN
jgi:hypothetical protein